MLSRVQTLLVFLAVMFSILDFSSIAQHLNVCISLRSPEKQPIGCIHATVGEIYFQELVHVIAGLASPKAAGQAEAGDPGKC